MSLTIDFPQRSCENHDRHTHDQRHADPTDHDGEEMEILPAAAANDPLKDMEGNIVIDCFLHTHATSRIMAQLVTDHYVSDIPYYRVSRYFKDNGMSVCCQTLINWLYEGGVELQKLILILLDMAVEKYSVVNYDETWCKISGHCPLIQYVAPHLDAYD